MRKFLSAFVIALAVCAVDVSVLRAQVSSVRVGPVSDEKASDVSGAPSPKKDDKKSNRPEGERKANPKSEARPRAGGEERKDGEAGTQTSSNISSKDAAIPPVGASATNTTSDAPPKSGSGTSVPVSTPAKTSAGELGGSETGKTPDASSVKNPNPNSTNGANGTTARPNSAPVLPPAPALTTLYRIGVGDVLDIRILNQSDTRQSTLYSVLTGGVLEYPLLRNPLTVSGMTPEELSAQLIAELKHRGVFDRPQVRVSVRDYGSHAVLVSGLVSDPGTKILRREAVPLYVVVAEAQPKPEAGRAVVVSHSTGKTTSVDLMDAASMNMLVQQGDVINIFARPPEFFYIGGEIGAPGQKDFHLGLTLTQAVLASGGVTRLSAGRVKVSRQGADGRLVSKEYNLREIEDGVIPDPSLQAGDRVEVARARSK
ncbi:MAG: polysaccharide biosynthesis/export family protein [Acidobacteria bacterium]|nr:polysaccharide biosynthesis/export family protein [Acidobacteriota bacterium]